MKKLFFVALMAGVFGFQSLSAQDLTIRVVTNNSNDKIAIGVTNDDGICFDNVTVVRTSVYNWNNTTRVLSLDGQPLQTFGTFQAIGVNNYFRLFVTSFYNSNAFNATLGDASLADNSDGTYTRN